MNARSHTYATKLLLALTLATGGATGVSACSDEGGEAGPAASAEPVAARPGPGGVATASSSTPSGSATVAMAPPAAPGTDPPRVTPRPDPAP
ncbi:MAG: hypothetical protein AAGN82_31910, partial [Myxococcota bacterium]